MSGLSLECRNCGAALVVGARQRSARCPYCASPSVIERPPGADRPPPAFVVGFVVTPERALELARAWLKRPLFAPGAFRRAAPHEITGLYAPAYLYSASAHASYAASIGEDYTVTETYTTTDSQGRTVTRTRSRVETEWRELRGELALYVNDCVVTASRGIPNHELEGIEPYDLRALRRYRADVVSGWAAEEPSLTGGECVALARQEAGAAVGARLERFLPGDSHRDVTWRTGMAHEDLALTLLPIWVLPVRYAPDKPLVRLLVNGQTGKIYGKAPVSVLRVIVAVLLALGVLAGAASALWLLGEHS